MARRVFGLRRLLRRDGSICVRLMDYHHEVESGLGGIKRYSHHNSRWCAKHRTNVGVPNTFRLLAFGNDVVGSFSYTFGTVRYIRGGSGG